VVGPVKVVLYGADMARMTYKVRKSLPDEAFALPKSRKYPLYTRRGNKPGGKLIFSASHAKNAVARAQQTYERGLLTGADKKSIDKQASKLLLGHHSFKTTAARRKAEQVAFGEFPFTKCMRTYVMPQPRGVPIYAVPMPRGSAPRYAPKGAPMRDFKELDAGAGYVARQDLNPVITDYPNDRRDEAMREWGGTVQASREWPGWGGGSEFGEDFVFDALGDDSEDLDDFDDDEFGRQWPYASSENPGWPGSPGMSSGYGPVYPYVPKPYAEFGRRERVGRGPTTNELYAKWLSGAPLTNVSLNKLHRAGRI
jgi:hypothetical protein